MKNARLSQWVVFFSWQSHSEWSNFLTILTILQFLNFFYNSYLAYEVLFLHHLRNSTGPKGTPLEYFRLWDLFFRKIIFSPKGLPFNFFSALWDFFQFFFIKGSPIHQYFDILKSFWYFWALDMAPTWAVLGLLWPFFGLVNILSPSSVLRGIF